MPREFPVNGNAIGCRFKSATQFNCLHLVIQELGGGLTKLVKGHVKEDTGTVMYIIMYW